MKDWQYQALVRAVSEGCKEILRKEKQNETLPKDKPKQDS